MLIASIIIAVIGIFYFWDFSTIKNSQESNPFKNYITNSGIIKISTIQFCLSILMTAILTSKIGRKKKNTNRFQFFGLIIISIGLGIIPWIEMWYGSTFYYGELRDKQGLGFPLLSLFFLIYPFWVFREEMKNLTLKQLSIRLISSVGIIIFATIFYGQIYEPWKIWQS